MMIVTVTFTAVITTTAGSGDAVTAAVLANPVFQLMYFNVGTSSLFTL